MHLSIIFILFISIYTISASPLPIASSINNIPAISKREDDVPIATDELINAWRNHEKNPLAGKGPELVFKSSYSQKPVLIKGYFLTSSQTMNQIGRQAETDVRIHQGLGDFVTWGKASNPIMDNVPHYMVVIGGAGNYISLASARTKLGSERVSTLRSSAINEILEKVKNVKPDYFMLSNFVFQLGPDGQWEAHYV